MILDDFSLDGQVAIVTGARTGIGRAIAEGLAEAGADIAGVSRGDMGELKQYVESLGKRFFGIRADVADMAMIQTIIDDTVRELGRLDILVNNAGTTHRAPAYEFTERDWDRVMAVNLKAVFFLCQAAARRFVQQGGGGKIINIASLMAYQGGILISPYTASKAGVSGLTKLLANEWAADGINVNAIAPGYILTDLTQPLKDDPVRNPDILSRIPAGRWGTPDDLKGLAVLLASRASSYMNGFTYAVDGGWLGR